MIVFGGWVRDVMTGAVSGWVRRKAVKLLGNFRSVKARVLASTVVALGAVGSAFATGGPASPDLSSLTPDFTTVTTGVLAVAGAIIGIYVAWKGAKIVITAVRGS